MKTKSKISEIQILESLKNFIAPLQFRVLRDCLKGEEKSWFAEKLAEIAKIVENMPKTYGTEKIKREDKIIHLHYFKNGCDWYIVEKDSGSPDDSPEEKGKQFQAWGFANIGYGLSGGGYISIEEIRENNIELDLHFTPKKLSELKK